MTWIRPAAPRTGWPTWALWAAAPVMLACGFVAGMAIAIYGSAPPTQPPVLAAPETEGPGDTAAQPPTPTDSSWRIPPTPTGGNVTLPDPSQWGPISPGPIPLPDETPPVTFTGEPKDIREARLALAADFSTYAGGGGLIEFEYQQMRQVEPGTAIVGMIKVSEYPDWVRALETDPEGLKAWLEAAARRVQTASQNDRFHLSWSVVDVLRERPAGFADHEITPLDNRTYLVIRPLAATMDHRTAEIDLRPLESLRQATLGRPVTVTSQWGAYAPLLRFDNTDLYRPPLVDGAKPFKGM